MAFSNSKTIAKAIAVCVAAALGTAALFGCSAAGSGASQQQNGNRQYMSQVNQVMDDLEIALANFNDAVSRDDVVGMQTQSNNALSMLDDLAGIEAPEDLADVKNGYEQGSDLLRTALNDYVALYTEIASATDGQPFDWSGYDARLAEIQKNYDEGIAKLKEADELAASKEGGSEAQNASGQQADGADDQSASDGQSTEADAK